MALCMFSSRKYQLWFVRTPQSYWALPVSCNRRSSSQSYKSSVRVLVVWNVFSAFFVVGGSFWRWACIHCIWHFLSAFQLSCKSWLRKLIISDRTEHEKNWTTQKGGYFWKSGRSLQPNKKRNRIFRQIKYLLEKSGENRPADDQNKNMASRCFERFRTCIQHWHCYPSSPFSALLRFSVFFTIYHISFVIHVLGHGCFFFSSSKTPQSHEEERRMFFLARLFAFLLTHSTGYHKASPGSTFSLRWL